ncbi:toxin C-terminal domain-containing protein [Nocardia jinanensis]|uniref:Novel toxin 21 domain-containing protein n=1 Tax=Nocardia jinanensis TaxID=382504 RepID=A0A917RZL7_9NOCA|nr:toxin C-terminal domain-containing protein [Nocardia jinanensis]GGL46782.1 hypothetical protein GCM10011588_72080 [Nocardia jinanensis]
MNFIHRLFAAGALIFAVLPLAGVAGAQVPMATPAAPPATVGIVFGPVEPHFETVGGKRFSDGEDRAAAQALGFSEAFVGRSHGCIIFKHKKKDLYITQDVDGHNGGRWKMADAAAKLGKKETRMGTYDEHLNRVGD